MITLLVDVQQFIVGFHVRFIASAWKVQGHIKEVHGLFICFNCDLETIGLYMLSLITPKFKDQVGLYRDDGLAVCKATPREIEKTKQEVSNVFKSHGLKITIEANKKTVNFLDVTLDLPFRVQWKVLATCKPYDNVSKKCNLCLKEKFFFLLFAETIYVH